MKTKLIVVGKTTNRHIQACIDDYASRTAHYMPFSVEVIPELKNTKALSEEQQKELEGQLILKRLSTADHVVLLDERGQMMRSLELASWLSRKQNAGRQLVFVIGGPYGFSESVYTRSNERLSLSPMTFSHQLIRLIFAEQLYRACTIIRGEPYHHE